MDRTVERAAEVLYEYIHGRKPAGFDKSTLSWAMAVNQAQALDNAEMLVD